MGTSQSVVARLENARHTPTFEMTARYEPTPARDVEL